MGIKFKNVINHISNKDFHDLDYQITGFAFQTHKVLGKFCDERIYQTCLANLCEKNGIRVNIETPIVVSFKNFVKKYYIDILINNSIIYELKSVVSLTNCHTNQILNYLLLTNCNYGKIINFGGYSVEKEFVTTTLTKEDRFNIFIEDDKWFNTDEDSIWLKKLVINLFHEWGGFLSFQLFYDAIYFFRGGKENIIKPIQILCNNFFIGTQNFHLLNNKTAFNLSSITKDKNKNYYKNNLQHFIQNTSLETLQWINFNNHNIEFETLKNR